MSTIIPKGMMIILSSPSGAGKTTLVKLLSSKNNNFKISISYTTRIPRHNEIEGNDYFFVEKKKFQNLVDNNCFFEYAKVFNNLYGTLKEPVIKELSKGNNVLFDIDWQGTKQIKKHNLNYKLFTIFILPPSIDAIKERLAKREIKDKPIINERMSQFKNDVLHWEEYDYVVINNDLENCYEEIFRAISLKGNNKKVDFDKNIIRKKAEELSS